MEVPNTPASVKYAWLLPSLYVTNTRSGAVDATEIHNPNDFALPGLMVVAGHTTMVFPDAPEMSINAAPTRKFALGFRYTTTPNVAFRRATSRNWRGELGVMIGNEAVV